jgi:hypothetical protein
MLANLTSCLNSYIFFGSEFILKSEDNVGTLLDMVSKAIMLGDENYSNKIEGCLVLQLAFQNFKVQQDYFYQRAPLVLKSIIDLLKQGTTSLCYKRQLCCIILSACIYDPLLTKNVLEELQFTNPFFSMVFDESMIYRSYYERKLFVFAICNILFMGQPSGAAELLKQLILMLIRQ